MAGGMGRDRWRRDRRRFSKVTHDWRLSRGGRYQSGFKTQREHRIGIDWREEWRESKDL